MALEFRTLNSEEMDLAETIAHQAFGAVERHDMTQALRRAHRDSKPEWYLGAFEDLEMTSMMRIVPSAMYLNGAAVPFGMVSPVAGSPLHRRKGHTGALLRHSLQVMRERGQCLAGLYTPHPAFYRRYGWEIAAEEVTFSFKAKDCVLQVRPQDRGRLEFVKPEDWPRLDALYRAYSLKHNGPLVRDEVIWYRWLFGVDFAEWHEGTDAVVWRDLSGVDRGYALFNLPRGSSRDTNKMRCTELVALTPDAYLNLIAFLAGHDIQEEVIYYAATDDPLPLLFADAERLQQRREFTVMLRVVDLVAALRARPVTSAQQLTFNLGVTDACAPWNEGVWRVRAQDGKASVERTQASPDLLLDARFLASVFNGYLRPSKAVAAGLAVCPDPSVLPDADAFFAASNVPYFPDRF